MKNIHYPVDGKHLAVCGLCTCEDPNIEFSYDVSEITCPECLAELAYNKIGV